jgi:hypothetical protein
MSRDLVWKSPKELRPHAINQLLYGPPSANSARADIRLSMKQRGFDDTYPLVITPDGRILSGVTRHDVAKELRLKEVPCVVFTPVSDNPEAEFEQQVILGNIGRRKTPVMVAREQRKALELEKTLAKARMGAGSDGGPSKSTDRVGKVFNVSGKTVARQIKVLNAIEKAEADGDSKKAARLTELLNAGKVVQAQAVIAGKQAAAKKPPKVEVKRSFGSHKETAYGEFFEACAKAKTPAEFDLLEGDLSRMHDDLRAARARLEQGQRG